MEDHLNQVYDLIEAQEFSKAIEIAKREAETDKENEFLYRRAIGKSLYDDYIIKKRTQKELKLSEDAVTELKKSWELEQKENEMTLLYLADAEQELNELDNAKTHYLQLVEILSKGGVEDPNQSMCFYSIAKIELKRQNYKECILQCQHVMDRKDKNELTKEEWGEFYYNRGVCYFNLEDLKNAEADIKQAIPYNPKNPRIFALQSQIFLRQNKFAEAEKFLSSIPKELLNDPIILDARGKIQCAVTFNYIHESTQIQRS